MIQGDASGLVVGVSLSAISCQFNPNFTLSYSKFKRSIGLLLRKFLTVDKEKPDSVANDCWLEYPLRGSADLTLLMYSGATLSDLDITPPHKPAEIIASLCI